jgi:hypothetical protein
VLRANSTWWMAFCIAESAEVNVQLSKSANESAPMHSQFSGGFALIPIGSSEDANNELLSKFLQCFGIKDSCPLHPQHQCLKLFLRGERVFSTHLTPERLFASLSGDGNGLSRFRSTPASAGWSIR